jgi:hypothetical protein
MSTVTPIRMPVTIGHIQTPADAMTAAVRTVLDACAAAEGIADGEAFLVFERAWQRAAQQRRAAARAKGSEAFEDERATQVEHLRCHAALVMDDTEARYDGDRWLGPSEDVIRELREAYARGVPTPEARETAA